MKTIHCCSILLPGAFGLINTVSKAQEPTLPNVLIILADDLGHGDLSYAGGEMPTPNIGKIFSQGVRFNNFMTWCVGSPKSEVIDN